MKSYFKRGLALVLAVALVVSSGLYVSSDRTLKATGEDEMYSEAGAETTQVVVEVQAEQEDAQPVAEAPAEEAPAQEPRRQRLPWKRRRQQKSVSCMCRPYPAAR